MSKANELTLVAHVGEHESEIGLLLLVTLDTFYAEEKTGFATVVILELHIGFPVRIQAALEDQPFRISIEVLVVNLVHSTDLLHHQHVTVVKIRLVASLEVSAIEV